MQAANLGLSDRVHFLGYRRDASRMLQNLDIYLQPSRFEGMPNAVLEAMAVGCPVIASAVDGHCELIEDGRSGWLVTLEDPVALTAALSASVADPAEARRRGNAARQRVIDYFSTEKMVAGWEAILSGAA
jgi:glycosyltransferase involved in cell wall biosynthesis